MRHELGEDVHERAVWSSIKRRFAEIIDPLPDSEFPKTFFSSVTRTTFATVGVDPAVEFVALDMDPLGSVTTHVETKVYANRGSVDLLVEELLADFRFHTPYRDFDLSVKRVADEIKASLDSGGERRTDRAARGHQGSLLPDDAGVPGRPHQRAGLDAAVRRGAAQPGERRARGRRHAGREAR